MPFSQTLFALGLAASACLVLVAGAAPELTLPMRARVQPFKNSDAWQAVTVHEKFAPRESAIIVCDMWDRHWCAGATQRVEVMARRMEPVLAKARAAGVLVIHAPSETMDFYKDYPQRKLFQSVPKVESPKELQITEPPLPIDDSDGGCDTPGTTEHKAWSRQIALLTIDPKDAISDDGAEIYSLLRQRNVGTVFIMGVHANMCILDRSFAIRQMSRWGMRCVLVRDLTDAMYNPARRPYVSHAAGTELVIEHIEKSWCPTVRSADFVAALDHAGGAGKTGR